MNVARIVRVSGAGRSASEPATWVAFWRSTPRHHWPMAEVAKAAEALVDSVIRAAEDAVSQAMQGEGHGAPQVRPQTLGLFRPVHI